MSGPRTDEPDDWAVFEVTTEASPDVGSRGRSSSASKEGAREPLHVKQAKAAAARHLGDGVDTVSQVPAAVAFEVFAGRQFLSTPRDNLSDAVAVDGAVGGRTNELARFQRDHRRREAGLHVESPLERYHRLKAEVAELAADVRVMSSESERRIRAGGADQGGQDSGKANSSTNSSSSSTTTNNNSDSVIPAAPWRQMSSGLDLLGKQLSDIAQTPAMQEAGLKLPGDPGRMSAQSVLSQQLMSDVAKLHENSDGGGNSTDKGPGSTSSGGRASNSSNRGTILVLDPSTRDAVAASRIAELEARFHRVETAIGDMSTFRHAVAMANSAARSAEGARVSGGVGGGSGTSEAILLAAEEDVAGSASGGSFPGGLLGIVSALEKRVELLTPGKLDVVGKRVAVLSAELKNLMTLRLQQAKMEVSSDGGGRADDEKVNELYGLLERLQVLDTELPGLVERLETLQGLHEQTATFAGRLKALEGATEAARASLAANETVVSELEASVAANAEAMAKNVKLLDEKYGR